LWGKALFILCGVLSGGGAVGGGLVPERRARELEWELILDVSAGKRGRGAGTGTNIEC
jgi:hypothetical protein